MNVTSCFHECLFSRKPLNPGPSEVITVKPGTDVAFECNAIPSIGRSLPMRSCKNAIVHYDDDSSTSDDDNDIYNYPDTNFEETEEQNSIESTKNSSMNDGKYENQSEPYGENSDEDSDPFGYREEMLRQNPTSSNYDY